MKLTIAMVILALAAVGTASPKINYNQVQVIDGDSPDRNILINALIRQAIEYLRYVIRNGSRLFGIAPLDPLDMEHFKLDLPLGLINLHLLLDNVQATGLGEFVVRTSNLNLRDLTFELDLVFPEFDISAEHYDFTGDLFTAIPLFGKGGAKFEARNFAIQAKIFLKQSDDGRSILVDRIEDVAFQIPHLKSNLTGVIGGGDIDAIVNAIIDEVLVGYLVRFHGVISLIGAEAAVRVLNPILDQLDTWRFISPLIPRS